VPTITLTITLEVPEGTTVDVKPQVTATTPDEDLIDPQVQIMRSTEPEYPEWKSGPGRPWGPDDIAAAQDAELSDADVAELTGRTLMAVQSYRVTHGYRQPTRARVLGKAPRAMQRWTLDELALVEKHYATSGPDWLAEQLGRTVGAIDSRASELGVRRPKE